MSWLKRSQYVPYGKQTSPGAGCTIVLSELTSVAGEIPDAIGWRYGHSVLVECKVSRSDFFADAAKPHRIHGSGPGEVRYFMVPEGLVKAAELPEGWGLLEVSGRSVNTVLKAPTRTIDLAGHKTEKIFLLSTIRRIRTREFLIISAEHLEECLEATND